MKNGIFLSFWCSIFSLGFASWVYGQNELKHVWSHAFNNNEPFAGAVRGRSIAVDASGNVIVAGTFENSADFDPGPGVSLLFGTGGTDIFLAKYSQSGNLLFAFALGSSGAETCNDVQVDEEGNIYITGAFSSTVDFDPGPAVLNLASQGNLDIYVSKFSSNGNLLMAKRSGGTNADEARAMAFDGSGNIFITGVNNSTPFFSKLNSAGDFLFTKFIGSNSINNEYGGSEIVTDVAGNIYITGDFIGSPDFDPGTATATLPGSGLRDAFFAKYDNEGNYVFAKKMGGSDNDYGRCIAVDGNGHIWVSGFFRQTADFDPSDAILNLSSAGSDDIFLAKYDASGNLLQANRFGGTSSDQVNGIVLDQANSVYITGRYLGNVDFDSGPGSSALQTIGSNLFVAGYQSNGEYIFARSLSCSNAIGSYIRGYALATLNDKLFVAGEFIGTATSSGANDISFVSGVVSGANIANSFWVGLSAMNGNTITASQLGGGNGSATSFSDNLNAMVRDASGNIYIGGFFNGTIDFDPSENVTHLTGAGANDIYLAKYTPNGELLFANRMGGTGADAATDLFIDAAGNMLVTGTFSGTVDFDPGPAEANLTSAGLTDIFFAKYNSDGAFLWAQRIGSTGNETVSLIAVNASGTIYLSGTFSNTVDFDPGAGVANLTSAGQTDMFLARYTSDGAYLGAFRVGGIFSEAPNAMTFDHQGNVVLAGSFNGSVAFNPDASANTPALVPAGSNDIFIAKYTPAGQYMFANRVGGASNDFAYGLVVNSTGEIFITGTFIGTVDFDPGAGISNIDGLGTSSIFIAKYANDGSFGFARMIGGNNASGSGLALALGKNGEIFMSGIFSGTIDADPGPGVVLLKPPFVNGKVIAVYDASGNYLYAASMGGNGFTSPRRLLLDTDDNLYTSGLFSRYADFDPGPDEAERLATNSNDIFLAKYSWGPAAQTGPYITAAPGNWDNPATWQGGKVPPLGAGVVVVHAIIVNVLATCKSLKVEPGASVQVAPGLELKILE